MLWTIFCLPFLLESPEVKEAQNLDPIQSFVAEISSYMLFSTWEIAVNAHSKIL